MKLGHMFARFSNAVAEGAGKPVTFCLSFMLVLLWAVSGPFFHYSETWQLVINTGTTIITFLMVFVLQNSQNRDSEALHAKIDELIISSKAQNKFVGIENLDEKELKQLSETLERQAADVKERVKRRAAAASQSTKSKDTKLPRKPGDANGSRAKQPPTKSAK